MSFKELTDENLVLDTYWKFISEIIPDPDSRSQNRDYKISNAGRVEDGPYREIRFGSVNPDTGDITSRFDRSVGEFKLKFIRIKLHAKEKTQIFSLLSQLRYCDDPDFEVYNTMLELEI